MLNSDFDCKFEFCNGWTEDLLKEIESMEFEKLERVCFVSTDTNKIYLVTHKGNISLMAYHKENNQWLIEPISSRVTDRPSADWYKSRESIEAHMKETLFRQCPKVEESFYEELPSADEVLDNLRVCPYVNRLVYKHYMFVLDGNQHVDDADGIATIWVNEGKICMPYTVVMDGTKVLPKSEWELQVDRALVHHETFLTAAESKMNKFFDSFNRHSSHSIWSKWCKIADRLFT